MTVLQLEDLTIKQLRDFRDRVDAAITVALIREKNELKARLAAMAAEQGLSLEEIVADSTHDKVGEVKAGGPKAGSPEAAVAGGASAKAGLGRVPGAGAASSVKYRNPQNSSETWSGRGRKPNWMVKAGGAAERFRVE